MTKYSCYSRYLASKKSLDDRSLNRYVWQSLAAELPQRPLEVLEIGAGIGTMVERVLAWDLFKGRPVVYRAIDSEPTNAVVMGKRMAKVQEQLVAAGVQVSAETIDLLDLLDSEAGSARYDLIISHAFLDLIDLPKQLERIMSLLKKAGLLYASINFDGVTSLQPQIDPALDAQIESAYHQVMDSRIINGAESGDSKAGRHLLATLQARGYPLLATGSSDWIVHCQLDGQYRDDEAYFLHFIIDTIVRSLKGGDTIDAAQLSQWQAQRHAQVDRGELIYMAHQLDVLTRRN